MNEHSRTMQLCVVLAAAGLVAGAKASVITDPAQIDAGAAAIITFEGMSLGLQPSPLTLGDVTFSAETGLGIASVAPYGADGTEVAGLTLKPDPSMTYDSGPYGTMVIAFADPISQFLVGWFDPNGPGNVARAFDGDGKLLEEGAVQSGPPGGCCAAWIGFVRATANIHSVHIVPSAPDDWYGIDNLHYVVGVSDPCRADLNGDGDVDGADLGVLLSNWGTGGAGDLDGSGAVDGADLGQLLAEWGDCD